ncbi:MAG TPA: glycine--tRNA ligase subunit alpha [Firmicutes bacterium]|nr:glycine--tRNA ligase subunit alpha [Bacillota bacterium]
MKKFLTFQEIIFKLQDYWNKNGCVIQQPLDIELGAGTFHPATFFGSLDLAPVSSAYVQPCRRPKDGRFGKNPNRLQKYYQFQVIIKPSPDNIQALYLKSLEVLGISIKHHDIRYIEDDWRSPTLGAWGLGWEVWLDGQEISQFTYFQQMGGISLKSVPVEITYGLERLAMFIQDLGSIHDIVWTGNYKYKDIHLREEIQFSEYNFNAASSELLFTLLDLYEKELTRLLGLDLLFPAYEHALKLSHIFNLLDARKAIAVFERANMINKIRQYSNQCAEKYLKLFGEANGN